MKKIKILSAIALTMVMASCDNFDLPNPPGQTNPEPDGIFENSGLVLTQGEEAVNLNTYNANNQDVTVATITELINFPENYNLEVEMRVSGNADFSKASTITTTISDKEVLVNPDIFNGAIQAAITKAPGNYTIYADFIAYAVYNTTRFRLGGLTSTYCPSKFQVTTLDPAKEIEQSYYFVPCNASGTPDLGKAIKMENTQGNVNAYDNPEFAVKIDVPAASDYRWMIFPQSAVTAGNVNGGYGCNPSPESDLTGKLGAEYAAGNISIQGSVLVTINVLDDAYSVNYAFEVLYPVSGRASITSVMQLHTDNYINYSGVTAANAYFTLYGDVNKTVVFTQNPDVEPIQSEDGTATGELFSGDSGITIKVPAGVKGNSLFWMDVNLVQLTYTITHLETLSVIGSGNGWDLATATPLTASSNLKTWTASDVTIGDEFKINANGAWTISFSGEKVYDNDSTKETVYNVRKQDGGANLQATPGTYDVTVSFATVPYTVTLKKK